MSSLSSKISSKMSSPSSKLVQRCLHHHLDEGVKDHFSPGNEDELNYGSVPMRPCIFQDDLIHASKKVDEATKASQKVNTIMKEHALQLNKDKSVLIVMKKSHLCVVTLK